MKILLAPDPQPGGDPAPASSETNPTAAETAAAGKSKREIALEKKVSEHEDVIQGLRTELKGITDYVSEAKKIPSARKPGKTLIDELNEFLCPSGQEDSPAPTPAKV